MTKPVLRRSAFAAWSTCSAYENGSSEAAAFGTLVHALIATHWAGEDIEAVLARPCGVTPERQDEARDLFTRFAASHAQRPDEWERTLIVETPDAILTGTPDAVYWLPDDGALVVDWKASWSAGDATFQLRWYCAQLAVLHPSLRTLHGRVDPIRRNEDGVVEMGPWDADELRFWWASEIVARVPAILAARSNPTPSGGSACTYCALRWSCAESIPESRHAPVDDDEAAEIARELIRLDGAVKERRKVLRQWFADREAAVVSGMAVGFMPPKEPSFHATTDPLTIASYLNESGRSGDAVLSLNSRQIGKALATELSLAGLGEISFSEPDFTVRKAS